jgi:hypothetical protein
MEIEGKVVATVNTNVLRPRAEGLPVPMVVTYDGESAEHRACRRLQT